MKSNASPGSTTTGTALIVVDMQEGFESRKNSLMRNVARAIIAAMHAGWPILFEEFNPHLHGQTHPELIALTERYERVFVLTKRAADGSSEVLTELSARGLSAERFVITGVETFCCVQATASGLCRKTSESLVEVVMDACHDPSFGNQWDYFFKHPRLALVDTDLLPALTPDEEALLKRSFPPGEDFRGILHDAGALMALIAGR